MAFLNPFFLLGAMAAALPVLVHLVRRTRATKVQFASLMFLRRIEQRTIRKRKLRNLALLALRCAALMLLAIAFARPYLTSPTSADAATDRASSVILVDGSYSMRHQDGFERARQEAHNVVSKARSDEQIALVLFGQGYDILMPLKANRAEASALIDSMKPGLGATDYLQAIQAADALLKDAGGGERQIHMISDFQQSGWNRAIPPVKIAPGIKLNTIDISSGEAANLAVSEVKAEPVVYAQKYAGKMVARVNNFGLEEASEAALEFKLNDLTVERRQLKLGPQSSETIEFSGFNVPDGTNRATIEVAGDNFTLDNKFHFTIRRENQTKVLAIETASRGRSESFFLTHSMAAGENNRYSLTVKTPGSVNPGELDSYRVVIVNDATGIADTLAVALKNFTERGGSLIIAVGKHTNASDFNRAFGEVAPAELGEAVISRGYSLMSQVKTDHPIFSAFAKSGRLTSTRVYGYHRASPNERASIIAALDDGSPMVIEGLAGRGKVLLITTTLDTSWNDLPITPMFLPLVRQMLEYLGGRETASAYKVGQVFTTPPEADGAMPAVESPGGGRLEDGRKNPSGELAVNANENGFYRLRYRDRADYVAVNLDAADSDFSKLNVDELKAAVTSEQGDLAGRAVPAERLTAEEIEAKQSLWLPLLILSLVLFVAEALLARRIKIAKLIS